MIETNARFRKIRQEPALQAILRFAHEPLYLVGGSVRDLLLGRHYHDLDLVVHGLVEDVARKAENAVGVRAVPIGKPPLQVFRLCPAGLTIDLCPMEGPDIQADLLRRDLTVNAMAIHLNPPHDEPRLLDPCHGLTDLLDRRVRFVSEANLLADPLRLLRLFRFAAVLDFTPDSDSLDLIRKHALLIQRMPGERIREELLELLGARRAYPVVMAMARHDLLEALVPELTPMRGCGQTDYHHLDVFQHTLEALNALEWLIDSPESYFPEFAHSFRMYLEQPHYPALMKLSILFHDLGKPATRTEEPDGRARFFRHESVGGTMARAVAKRFKLALAERDLIDALILNHMRPFHLLTAYLQEALTSKGIYRFGRAAGKDIWGLMMHALADAAAARGPSQTDRGGLPVLRRFLNYVIKEIVAQRNELAERPNLVSANEIMLAYNLKPGPEIGRLLRAVEEAQATGRIRERDEALILVANLLEAAPVQE